MNATPSIIAPDLARELWETFDVDLDTLVESIDTESLADIFPDRPTRALVVVNASPTPFSEIARLDVDFRTRETATPLVFSFDGRILPSRIVAESRGETDEDGKFRWRFSLEFIVEIEPETAVALGSVWRTAESASDENAQSPDFTNLPNVLPAFETLCRPGNLPNPYVMNPRHSIG